MASGQDPMVQRRRLRVELRKAREAAGFSQKQVAPEMDWSLSKLLRIEAGMVNISINDLRVLLQHYGVTDQGRIDTLVAMARAAKEPAWWLPYKDVLSPEFSTFLSYESAASIIRNFEPILVPGLLQTEEYARAALAATVPPVATPDADQLGKVDSLVELRMERQDRLAQSRDKPKMFFAMDEAVLHHAVGGPDLMGRQLQRLRAALSDPDATVWIVPYSAGLYQLMRGSYVLFELPMAEDNEDILYIEDFRGELLIRDDSQEAAVYLEAFWRIEQLALKNEDALGLVEQAIAALELRALNVA